MGSWIWLILSKLQLDVQEQIEQDRSYYLDHSERREIIVIEEKPHRRDAEKTFSELVNSALVFQTLIPEVEENLLEKGSRELLLTNEKNAVSFKVETAQEIIDLRRQLFEEILSKQVQSLAKSRKMEDYLVKEFNLRYKAYISQTDVDHFVKTYKPANSEEITTVMNSFEKHAAQKQLYIVPHNATDDFANLLEKTVERTSQKYKFGLKRWLTSKFEENMVKVGAAYGVAEDTVKLEIDEIKKIYPKWTLPNWPRLILWFLSITGVFVLLRGLISLTGYLEWIFISGPVRFYEKYPSFRTIGWHRAWAMSEDDLWIITLIVLVIVVPIAIAVKRSR